MPEAAADTADSPPLSPAATLIVTCATMLATVMQGVDGTIANVALPYMQGSMSASQEQINWVLTSYIVASAIMTAPTGYLTARFGRMRLYVTVVTGFTVASVLCGMAQSLGQIVLFRVLQGMCGAALVPLSQLVLLEIYPPEKRGSAMGVWMVGVMMGPILGPTIGGFLTSHYSWRSVFYVNVPFGLATSLGLLFFLPESAHGRAVRLDWIGFASLSLAIGMFQTVLDRGETLDWFSSTEIIIETILAVIGFYVFLMQFFLSPKPFLPPRLFTDLNFVVALVLIFLVGGTLYSTLALLAPYVQNLMAYPVSTAGIVLAPRGAGSMFAALVCGRIMQKVSPRNIVILGIIIAAYVQYTMVYWSPDISAETIFVTGFIQGIGVTFITVPISLIAYATLPADLRSDATSVFSLLRTLGSAIGISVTGAMLEVNTQVNHAVIASAVTPFNHALAAAGPAQFWNPAQQGGAFALDGEITRQATIIAYSDDFKLMFLMTLLTLPLVLLVRSAAGQRGLPQEEALAE